MSEAQKRKVHSPELKSKVGLEAVRGLKTINEIAQECGVHPVQVGLWKKAIQEQAKSLFEGKRGPKPVVEHQRPEQLYSKIGKLKMELDWLKKSPGSTRPRRLYQSTKPFRSQARIFTLSRWRLQNTNTASSNGFSSIASWTSSERPSMDLRMSTGSRQRYTDIVNSGRIMWPPPH